MQRFILVMFFLGWITSEGFAQKDVSNSKDHPLLSRYEGSWIKRYDYKQFESYSYPASAELVNSNKLKDSNAIEGEVTFIEYESAEGVTATQIYRTFEIQLVKAGFKLVFSCRSADCGNMPMHFVRNYIDGSEDLGNSMVEKKGSFIVATGSHENETYYVIIVVGENSHEKMSRYVINIIKQENLDTNKVDVASVSDKIKMEGSYAFYGIQFDLNSAVLKPEADESLDLMADYLARFSDLKVLIVGHTDNSGEFEMNKVLSEKRAEAVVSVLISKYKIDRKRLTPVGVGMASPKASNANEEGKSINRRVEIVLK